jgi:hypothetical protein
MVSTSVPGAATITACTRSATEPGCVTPTTADSLTPGISFNTRSTSSGKMLRPSAVTIISFLRPRMCSCPLSSNAPMSPV